MPLKKGPSFGRDNGNPAADQATATSPWAGKRPTTPALTMVGTASNLKEF
jgi:hypothetical protein